MDVFSIAMEVLVGVAAGFFYVRWRFWLRMAQLFEAQRNEIARVAGAAIMGDHETAYRLLRTSKYMTIKKKPSPRGDA